MNKDMCETIKKRLMGYAASVCILAKERNEIQIGLQILNYPYLDLIKNPIEKGHPEEELPLFQLAHELYANLEQLKDAHISPIYATREQLICLLEAIITLAENDALNSEGNIYIKMLREAGVKVTERVAKRMPHEYFKTSYNYQTEEAFIPENTKLLIADGSLLKEQEDTLEFIRKAYEEWKSKH
ncbi:alpha/beta hydrolase [Clostridium sp. P21]|uniref:Alpha/beta hydrolase n=1 Tax=Clostridium muellerianum TaxID=2716538 RepID=A0A7Y0HRH4_9CLOT|nr:alpha/beta hydrolase fold domain-containing protein [Clostridium muellerianum]NMM65206.1 alpha/beta hydrolase [Clostridium muellerianum]